MLRDAFRTITKMGVDPWRTVDDIGRDGVKWIPTHDKAIKNNGGEDPFAAVRVLDGAFKTITGMGGDPWEVLKDAEGQRMLDCFLSTM